MQILRRREKYYTKQFSKVGRSVSCPRWKMCIPFTGENLSFRACKHFLNVPQGFGQSLGYISQRVYVWVHNLCLVKIQVDNLLWWYIMTGGLKPLGGIMFNVIIWATEGCGNSSELGMELLQSGANAFMSTWSGTCKDISWNEIQSNFKIQLINV